MKKLEIRPEFAGARRSELESFVVKHSKTNVLPANYDIESIVVGSPHEVGSIPFCRYFFANVLGENSVFPEYYFGPTGRPAYFMKEVSGFLDEFTNASELEKEVEALFNSITAPIVTFSDPETVNKILLVHRKLAKWKRPRSPDEGSLFGKVVSLTDGKVLFVESQDDFKDIGFPSRKTNKIFFNLSDVADLVRYYTSVVASKRA